MLDVHTLLVATGVSSSVQCAERSYSNLLLMFFPVSINFKLLATLLLFYIIYWFCYSEISLDVKSVLRQCIYRQCAVGLCGRNSAHGISTDN